MSYGAWGEPEEVTTWAETAMYQDFIKLRDNFSAWCREFNGEFPNADFEKLVKDLSQSIEDVEMEMQGEL